MSWWTVFAGGVEVARNVASASPPAGWGDDAVAVAQPRRLNDGDFERLDESGAIVADLAAARAWALERIDRARSVALARRFGGSPEIREMHRLKAAEATMLIAGGSDCPILDAEAAATGQALVDLTAEVLANAWTQRSAAAGIEAAAMAAKRGVRDASDVAGIKAAAAVELE